MCNATFKKIIQQKINNLNMKRQKVKNFPFCAKSTTKSKISSDPDHLKSLAIHSLVGAYQVNQTHTN